MGGEVAARVMLPPRVLRDNYDGVITIDVSGVKLVRVRDESVSPFIEPIKPTSKVAALKQGHGVSTVMNDIVLADNVVAVNRIEPEVLDYGV